MAVDGVPDDTSRRRPRVLVVGAGFAGFHCLRTLESRLPPEAAELVAVNPADYMLYVPLLPEVAAAILEPRRVTVPLRARLPRTQVALGTSRQSILPRGRARWSMSSVGRGRWPGIGWSWPAAR